MDRLSSFILLKLRSQFVEETGMISAPVIIDITVGNASLYGLNFSYNFMMDFNFSSFIIGLIAFNFLTQKRLQLRKIGQTVKNICVTVEQEKKSTTYV